MRDDVRKKDLIVSDVFSDQEKAKIKEWLAKDNIQVPGDWLNEAALNNTAKEWFPDIAPADDVRKINEEKKEDEKEGKKELNEEEAKAQENPIKNKDQPNKNVESKPQEADAKIKNDENVKNGKEEINNEKIEADPKKENIEEQKEEKKEEKGKEKEEENVEVTKKLADKRAKFVAFVKRNGINLEALSEEDKTEIKKLVNDDRDLIQMDDDNKGLLKDSDQKTAWEKYLESQITENSLAPEDLNKLYIFANGNKYLLYNLDSRLTDGGEKDKAVEQNLTGLADALKNDGTFKTPASAKVKLKWNPEPRKGLTIKDSDELSVVEEFKIKQFIRDLPYDGEAIAVETAKKKLTQFAINKKLLIYNIDPRVAPPLRQLLPLINDDGNFNSAEDEAQWGNESGGLKHQLMYAAGQLEIRHPYYCEGTWNDEGKHEEKNQTFLALSGFILGENPGKALLDFARAHKIQLFSLGKDYSHPQIFYFDLIKLAEMLTEDEPPQLAAEELSNFYALMLDWNLKNEADKNAHAEIVKKESATFSKRIRKSEEVDVNGDANIYDAVDFYEVTILGKLPGQVTSREVKPLTDEVKNLTFILNSEEHDDVSLPGTTLTHFLTPRTQYDCHNQPFLNEIQKAIGTISESEEEERHVFTVLIRPNDRPHFQRFLLIVDKSEDDLTIRILHIDPQAKSDGYGTDEDANDLKAKDKALRLDFLNSIKVALKDFPEFKEDIDEKIQFEYDETFFDGIQKPGSDSCLDCNIFQTITQTMPNTWVAGKMNEAVPPPEGEAFDANQTKQLRKCVVQGCVGFNSKNIIIKFDRTGEKLYYQGAIPKRNPSEPDLAKQPLPAEELTVRFKDQGSLILQNPWFSEDYEDNFHTTFFDDWKTDCTVSGVNCTADPAKRTYQVTVALQEKAQPEKELTLTRSEHSDTKILYNELKFDSKSAKDCNIDTQLKVMATALYIDRKSVTPFGQPVEIVIHDFNLPNYKEKFLEYLTKVGFSAVHFAEKGKVVESHGNPTIKYSGPATFGYSPAAGAAREVAPLDGAPAAGEVDLPVLAPVPGGAGEEAPDEESTTGSEKEEGEGSGDEDEAGTEGEESEENTEDEEEDENQKFVPKRDVVRRRVKEELKVEAAGDQRQIGTGGGTYSEEEDEEESTTDEDSAGAKGANPKEKRAKAVVKAGGKDLEEEERSTNGMEMQAF